MNILLVEDHADTADLMRRLLGAAGHEVRVAGTAADAVKVVRAEPFDLIICDVCLPDGSGLDLIGHLHALRPIKAIALSGHATAEDIERSLSAGFSAHLAKPVDWPKLVAAIA